jgi:hypothetical protein
MGGGSSSSPESDPCSSSCGSAGFSSRASRRLGSMPRQEVRSRDSLWNWPQEGRELGLALQKLGVGVEVAAECGDVVVGQDRRDLRELLQARLGGDGGAEMHGEDHRRHRDAELALVHAPTLHNEAPTRPSHACVVPGLAGPARPLRAGLPEEGAEGKGASFTGAGAPPAGAAEGFGSGAPGAGGRPGGRPAAARRAGARAAGRRPPGAGRRGGRGRRRPLARSRSCPMRGRGEKPVKSRTSAERPASEPTGRRPGPGPCRRPGGW